MKKSLKLVALLLAVLMIAAVAFTACTTEPADKEEPDTTTTTTAKQEENPTVTEPVETEEPEPEPEAPVRGDDAEAFHNQFALAEVDVDTIVAEGLSAWGDGAPEQIFDGDDGYFNPDSTVTDNGSGTKLGGGVSGQLDLYFDTTEAVKLVAYSFITGGDASKYPERMPAEWTLYGSEDGENYDKVLDYVYDGAMEAIDSEYFGFSIDEEAQGTYQHYLLSVTYTMTGPIGAVQLNEMYLYIAK